MNWVLLYKEYNGDGNHIRMKFYITKEETIKVLEEEAKSYLYQLDDEE